MQNKIKNSLEITFGKPVRVEENGKTLKVNITKIDKISLYQLGTILNVHQKQIKVFDINRSGAGLVIIVKTV